MNKEQLSALQENARRAWKGSTRRDDPPTVQDLVECLTNLACSRYSRIRELERALAKLLELNKPQ